jgi:hypothetical protein
MSEQLVSHPKNHCVPFLEVLSPLNDDDRQVIVMPLLLPFARPRFDTFGEVVECFSQLFEVSTTAIKFASCLSHAL